MPKSENLPVSEVLSALDEDADFVKDFVGEDTEIGAVMFVFSITEEDEPELFDFLMSKPNTTDYVEALLLEALREKKALETQGE